MADVAEEHSLQANTLTLAETDVAGVVVTSPCSQPVSVLPLDRR